MLRLSLVFGRKSSMFFSRTWLSRRRVMARQWSGLSGDRCQSSQWGRLWGSPTTPRQHLTMENISLPLSTPSDRHSCISRRLTWTKREKNEQWIEIWFGVWTDCQRRGRKRGRNGGERERGAERDWLQLIYGHLRNDLYLHCYTLGLWVSENYLTSYSN